MNENDIRRIQKIRKRASLEMAVLLDLGLEISDLGLRTLHQIAVQYVNDAEGPFLLGKLGRGNLTEQEATVILRRAEAVLQLATNHRKSIQDAIDKHRQPEMVLAG